MCNNSDTDLLDDFDCDFGSCNVNEIESRSPHEYFLVDEANSSHVLFVCYKNFHYVSGDLIHVCQKNNTWSGEVPVCEVDFMMERFRLSFLITGVVMFLCSCILLPDFIQFYLRKRSFKIDRARVNLVKTSYGGEEYGRAMPHGAKSNYLTRMIYRKSYFNSYYEEDFLNVSAAHRGELSAEEIKAAAAVEQRRKPTTLLSILTQGLHHRSADEYV